jgi:hypothetical protein
MEIKIQKLSRKLYERAQMMYFGDIDISEIAMTMNIDPSTLRFYIFGEDEQGTNKACWSQLKKKLKPTVLALYLKDKAQVMDQTAGVALEIVTMSLGKVRDELRTNPDYRLSVQEISQISKIAVDMDKMVRLESGQATELIEHMGLSLGEAREIIASDPFAEAVEAEYKIMPPWLLEGDNND